MAQAPGHRSESSFADELIAALTVHAGRQISGVMRRGLGRPRARNRPPRVVAGLQVPTGGTVATLLLAGLIEERLDAEGLDALERALSDHMVRKKRDSLRVLVNKALEGDVHSFKEEWLGALAFSCDLPSDIVRNSADGLREAR